MSELSSGDAADLIRLQFRLTRQFGFRLGLPMNRSADLRIGALVRTALKRADSGIIAPGHGEFMVMARGFEIVEVAYELAPGMKPSAAPMGENPPFAIFSNQAGLRTHSRIRPRLPPASPIRESD